MRTKHFLVTCLVTVCSFQSLAQSKIDCKVNAQNGRYEAPLAWQNTLGTLRANSMCHDAASLANKTSVTPAVVLPPVKVPDPATPPKPRFATVSGERASAALQRWSEQSGFNLVWDAPKQTDLIMNTGVVEGPEFLDAVGKLVVGLNSKLEAKRSANDPEAPWSLPVEAIKYSNGVVRVVVKQ